MTDPRTTTPTTPSPTDAHDSAASTPASGAGDAAAKPYTGSGDLPHAGSSKAASGEQGNFALYPPDSPVDVPNLPRPDPKLDEAAKQSQPRADEQEESNWADNDKPAPNAKNARSSLL